jgi:hypothetical protein
MEHGSTSIVEAVVQVGEVATSYLRCGRGAPIVLVALDAALRLRLMAGLSREHCVIAPLLPPQATSPPDATSLADWLRGVIDGLGLEQAEIVLAADAAVLALPIRAACEQPVRVLRYGSRSGRGGFQAHT